MQEVKNIFEYTDAERCPFFCGKSEFIEPINNVQCTMYNRAVVAIQAVIVNHCTL